jgi:hypothetical protein
MKKILVLIVFIVFTYNCERDDICAEGTPTTPRLIIEFYDFSNPEQLKNVVRLTAYGEGLVLDENGNPTQPETASNATLVFNSNENTLALPLLVENEGAIVTTTYILENETNLRLDNNPDTESNVDIIEISYIPRFDYVSRACGYKSIFQDLDIDLITDDVNWITDIDVIESTIDNENTVHVQIFH